MLKVRFPHTLPFALLASLAAACSSSSGGTTPEQDGGMQHNPDTGVQQHPDTGTTPDTGTVHDSGEKKDVVAPPPSDGGSASCPVPPAGATAILTKQIVQVEGLTTDGYIIFFDATNGISAVGTTGAPVQIAPGPTTDGGIGPVIAGISGNIVGILTDYTTKTVMGTAQPVEGTLSIWSHTQTGGVLKQIATNATGFLSIATDSSFATYIDGANPAATVGNIGVVSGAGTNPTDFVTGVAIDTTAATCAPWATTTHDAVVASTCTVVDGGGDLGPTIASYTGTGYATKTVFSTDGTPSFLGSATAPETFNFGTDTLGDNVITSYKVGTTVTLGVQGITSTSPTVLQTPFTAPVSGANTGTSFYYLSQASTYAIWTEPSAVLGIAKFASPSSTPTISTLSTDTVLGVQGISPDDNWILDYGTAVDPTTSAPTSLRLRSTSTGTATPLLTGNGTVSGFGAGNSFTGDSKYAIYTTDLKANAVGTTGTLNTAATATGTINKIVTNQTVWLASPLAGGDNIIYNQNYIVNTNTSSAFGGADINGLASGDIYVVSASGAGPGTLVASGADAPEDALYATADGHLFITYTTLVNGDGGFEQCASNGLYVMTLPAAP